MVYQRNKKAKGDPPLQQQSKRGLQQKSGLQPGPTGPATGLSGAQLGQPVANRGSPAHDPVDRPPTGFFTRTQQIRLPTGQPAYRPASPAHGPVDRSPTGRQPAANRRSSMTSKVRPVTGPV